MYVSYFEFRQIISKLEEEYGQLQKDPRVQTDKKFGFYGQIVVRRVDKEMKELLKEKYPNNNSWRLCKKML